MKFLLILILIILLVVVILVVFGVYRTYVTQTNQDQQQFLKGRIPDKKPDGLHKGTADGYRGSWKGKKFDSKHSTGINVLEEKGKQAERYPFKTYVGKGIHDKELNVIKIDYNISQNPLWLRLILDEIVEVQPNKYLGKLTLNIIPHMPFALAFFRLEK